VPVFVFHSVEPDGFGRRLSYLAENGYATLGADELLAVLRGEATAPDRAVVLTFDDGRGSLWSVAAPLLRRHGMRGVVFLVPGRVPSRTGPPAPTWSDVEAGRVPADAVLLREQRGAAFLSWEEIEALARDGVFEFQSHTLLHSRVHVAPEVVDFVSPAVQEGYAAMDVPLVASEGRDLLAPEVPLGTPLLRSLPRTSEAVRFLEEPGLRAEPVRVAEEEGGARFFERPDWRGRLRATLRGRAVAGRTESPAEREEALRGELAGARSLLEQRLGRRVLHLCYPWHAAGETARRLAREAGYLTAFCGKVPGVPLTTPGGDPERIARVGEDWLELLPGRGRHRLRDVLGRKIARTRRRVAR
jgi:peptidoglycan/xylan/chitin deacetylase (PgdA/CDA1 family)